MKRLASLLAAFLLGSLLAGAAEGPDDRFVTAYGLIQQADSLLDNGQQSIALDRYLAAETILKEIQNNYPSWNEKVVTYRINYIQKKTAPLAGLPKPNLAPKPAEAPKPSPTAAPIVTETSARAVELEQLIRQLQGEKNLLTAKLREALSAQPAPLDPRELTRAEDRIKSLEKENSLLRATLDQAKEAQPPKVDSAAEASRKQLDEAKRDLARQKDAAESLTRSNQKLEKELASLQSETSVLKEKLDEAKRTAQKPAPKAPPTPATDASEFNSLRARLAVLEAQKIPFTAEELALLKPAAPKTQPTVAIATTAPAPKVAKAPRKIPPGAGPLLAEAQASFAARRYAEAEQKYKDVLRIDSTNPGALAYLAAAQMELNRPEDAEANLRKAIAEEPDHPFSLAMLGYLALVREKYQNAFEFLSHAAQVDPKNPNVQNNLGITLSKLGQRGPAEIAFRKALQMYPDFEDAHFNLAAIYAHQQPPFLELARFHYNKAIVGGHAKDANLEKILNPAP